MTAGVLEKSSHLLDIINSKDLDQVYLCLSSFGVKLLHFHTSERKGCNLSSLQPWEFIKNKFSFYLPPLMNSAFVLIYLAPGKPLYHCRITYHRLTCGTTVNFNINCTYTFSHTLPGVRTDFGLRKILLCYHK